MASDAAAIERLQSSVEEGRAENGRYRQDQLHALHKSLREKADQICAALQADSKSSAAEVETEFYLAMEAVRHFYETINFEKDLEEEYSVAHGKDDKSRRVGLGLVVLRPTSHTRFYSIVTPLAAAIAAGNCVLLELSDTILQIDTVLRKALSEALNVNTFTVVKASIDSTPIEGSVVVDQTHTAKASAGSLASSGARCVAVVDGRANIDSAAKAITAARFSFGGTSPYAPDLVLVHEFVKKEFFEACSRYASLSFAGQTGAKRISENVSEDIRKAIQDAEDKKQVSSFGSNDFKLVDVLDRSTAITKMKVTGRYLPIATYSSLTDAIYNYDLGDSLLAGYFFAEPATAKYLAQFLPCHISLINQIPAHFLVGPAAPISHAPDFLYRYNRDMFSAPRPQFVQKPPADFCKVDELLAGGAGKTKAGVSTSALRSTAVKPLPPTGQSENSGVGFFESGVLLGASFYVPIILSTMGFTVYFLGRKGLELASRLRH